MNKKNRIVFIDIETSYTLSATWGLFEQNVAKVLREPFIMSVSWKELGDNKTKVKALPDFVLYKKDKFNDIELVKFIKDEIFEKADVVVAHNGNSYDIKWIYGRFAVHKIPPPTPVKYIDTLLVARSKFKFNSNRLKDLGKYFGLGDKIDTGGIDLWYNCIELNNMASWNLMKKYNKQDVVLLEKIYLHILPFITNHPNLNLLQDTTHNCPNCGSGAVNKRGFNYTRTTKAQAYQCRSCFSWSSGEKIIR